MKKEFDKSLFSFNIQGIELKLSAIHREGNSNAPIVFLHGFGSSKEDYADVVRQSELDGHPFLAYDAPGCGETICSDLSKLSIPFLVETAITLIERIGYKRFHLIGHSMGGLTALILAYKFPERVISFVNIEGNIAPEDCFLSRQIINYPNNDDEQFFDEFIERTLHSSAYSSALYAASLKHKVRAKAVRRIFQSMVYFSDNENLMDKFLHLPFPRMFMYGDQNASLSYLKHLHNNGVKLAEIPYCGHFPMYSNPQTMWEEIVNFYDSNL